MHACIYFIHGNDDNLLFYSDPHTFAKCKKFGIADLVSNEISYDYADICRITNTKCGTNGAYYPFGDYNKINHYMRKNCTYFQQDASFIAIYFFIWIKNIVIM